jgi:hypothetical protein
MDLESGHALRAMRMTSAADDVPSISIIEGFDMDQEELFGVFGQSLDIITTNR